MLDVPSSALSPLTLKPFSYVATDRRNIDMPTYVYLSVKCGPPPNDHSEDCLSRTCLSNVTSPIDLISLLPEHLGGSLG